MYMDKEKNSKWVAPFYGLGILGWPAFVGFFACVRHRWSDLAWCSVLYLFMNLLLIGIGLFSIRFAGRIKKGKNRVLLVPLLEEILMTILVGFLVDRQVGLYTSFVVSGVFCVICSIAVTIAGYRIQTYNKKVCFISNAMALLLFIILLYVTQYDYDLQDDIYRWYERIQSHFQPHYQWCVTVSVTMAVQPLVVLLPIVCFIKEALKESDEADKKPKINVNGLTGKTDETQAVCPSCGKEQKVGYQFCVQCGQSMTVNWQEKRFCPQCGAKLEQDMIFCRECGVRI